MMEYFSALKMKEIFSHFATWVNFEDIILGEMNKSYLQFHVYNVSKIA